MNNPITNAQFIEDVKSVIEQANGKILLNDLKKALRAGRYGCAATVKNSSGNYIDIRPVSNRKWQLCADYYLCQDLRENGFEIKRERFDYVTIAE